MSEIKIKRNFPQPPKTVYDYVTQTEHLLKWWGPETIFIADNDLDLSKPGPWYSVMENKEGKTFKVSGEVFNVEPPHKVSFSWAWHDENDVRGQESRVEFSIAANKAGGTEFVIIHTELPDDESAANHNQGWTSSLIKLEKLAK